MGIGVPRPRNWGVESQNAALAILMLRRKVTYKVEHDKQQHLVLKLAAHDEEKGITLPFEDAAELVNVERGRWKAFSLWDGRELASGISQRDVVRATIDAVWH